MRVGYLSICWGCYVSVVAKNIATYLILVATYLILIREMKVKLLSAVALSRYLHAKVQSVDPFKELTLAVAYGCTVPLLRKVRTTIIF